jgi:TolB-like protein/DNA-binding winged helix-turn-helix (wHTH) protein/Tfp pilus assembly protein PilF
MQQPSKCGYSFGPFLLDLVEKVLLRDEHPIHLPLKAFETLLALVENEGHILEKGELLNRVWPNTFVEEATLAQNIFVLRKALGEGTNGQGYIETVPKRGYRFVAPVEPRPIATGNPAQAVPQMRSGNGLGFWTLAMATGVLVLAGTWWDWGRIRFHKNSAGSKMMLAVIPLENLSGDPGQEYFCDGLTEELVTKLGSLSPAHLGVIARTTTMQYKNAHKNAGRVGNELGVDYIVEGAVIREKERVRINAQLIRVHDQTHLWAQSYERDLEGVLTLQNDVATAIANAVEFNLVPGRQPGNTRNGTLNPVAYDAYLGGRYFWSKRSEQGHLKAIEYFNEAIANDPEYAQAYSGLADAYALLGSNPNTAMKRPEAMEKARVAALKALAIDDALAEAHTSLAFVNWHYDWNWPAAEKEFQRALQLNPSYPTAHHWYALYVLSQGRMTQALQEIRAAQQTDPLSLIINTDAAEMLFFARRYDQAFEQANRVLEMEPRFTLARIVLVLCLLEKHDYEAGLGEAKKAVHLVAGDSEAESILAVTYAAIGDKNNARIVLRKLRMQEKNLPVDPILIGFAQAYALLGDNDQAFRVLDQDLRSRNGGLTLIRFLPFLDSLHNDPRYAELIRRIGLPTN